MFRSALIVLLCLSASVPCRSSRAADSVNPQISDADAARRVGWVNALSLVALLEKTSPERTPGIHAWLADYHRAVLAFDLKSLPGSWPRINADDLLTNNPNFWSAYFEVGPGDPGILGLHASLMVAAGELNRGAYLAELARWRTSDHRLQTPPLSLANAAWRGTHRAHELIMAGIKLHDAGKYDQALEMYEQALDVWPECGLAQHEIAQTNMMMTLAKSKIDFEISARERNDRYALARQHDPLLFMSYQGFAEAGQSEALIKLLVSGKRIQQDVCPQFELLRKRDAVPDVLIEQFSDACSEAHLHELSLVARQVLVGRRGGYVARDHELIAASLRGMLTGERGEQVVQAVTAPTARPVVGLIRVPTEKHQAPVAQQTSARP